MNFKKSYFYVYAQYKYLALKKKNNLFTVLYYIYVY